MPASLKADVKAEAKAEQASASDVMTSVDQVNALIYNKKKKEEDKTTVSMPTTRGHFFLTNLIRHPRFLSVAQY